MNPIQRPAPVALPATQVTQTKALAQPSPLSGLGAAAKTAGDQRLEAAMQASGRATQSLQFVETTPSSSASPSPSDLAWANNIQAKVQQGYRPDSAETQRYEALVEQVAQSQASQPILPKQMPVTEQERNWALSLESQVRQGHTPDAKELQAYQNISQRLLLADYQPERPASVSEAELAWANHFQQQVNQDGYQPNQQQMDAYTDIYNRLQAASVEPASPVAVNPADQSWAKGLVQRMQQGYQPSSADQQRYQNIYLQGLSEPGVKSLCADDLNFMQSLQNRVEQGYSPQAAEMKRYADVMTRLNILDPATIQPTDRVLSQHELDWAVQLKERSQSGIPASPAELKRYQSIHQQLIKHESFPTPFKK